MNFETTTFRFEDLTVNFDKRRIPLSSGQRENRQGQYRYYGAQGVIDYVDDYIFDGKYLLIAEDGENLKSKKQDIAQIVEGKFWVNNHAHVVQGNALCLTEYLCYLLNHNDLSGYITGSAQPKLSQANLNAIAFDIPSIETQQKIVSIISALEEKIAINRAINDNLEQQVQTLFADWLSANSESATEIALGNICTKVTDGSHFSPKDDSTSSIPMLSVKDMREFDFDLTSCKHICEDDYEKMVDNDCVPQVNDILVAKDGSYLKEIFICNEKRKLAILSSIAIFRPNTTVIHPEILLAFLKSPRVLQEVRDNYVSGSALPRIVLKDFKKLTFSLPDMDAQNLIAPLFASIREQIAVNVAENKYMTQLRDTLLPKLMSGELNVDNIHL